MNQNILEKLRKLIAHERSAREINSTHEAELFAKKIQHLLTEHSLSLSDIDIQTEDDGGVSQTVIPKGSRDRWRELLLVAIAEANSCGLLKRGQSFILIGVEADKQICATLFNYFTELADDLCRSEALNAKEDWWTSGNTVRFKTSFRAGFAQALGRRLVSEAVRSRADAASANPTSSALIHIGNKESLVKKSIADMKPRSARPWTVNVDDDAYARGRNAGNSVALSDKALKEAA